MSSDDTGVESTSIGSAKLTLEAKPKPKTALTLLANSFLFNGLYSP
jgi:hypothetical protein